ncbi:MAG: MotA/TolQ/ExbB proton channel family protein [Epsilonproteobacteria bacterium]|nr:MotA/TolQ/ExbB proton channel family protein [Campylobacterota bacterium]
MLDIIVSYLHNSSVITISVLVILSIYLILTILLYIYKLLELSSAIKNEIDSLNSLSRREFKVNPLTSIGNFLGNEKEINRESLEVYEISMIRDASTGLSWQSIIASTAPFIGLFGTVVGILESFASFKNISKVSFSAIAPAISEALIATAAGIFVAILAYTFHQILVRKIYILNTYIKSQINIILSRN